MSGDLFEKIANPTVKVGTQKWYAGPLCRRSRRDDRWHLDGAVAGGRPASEVIHLGVHRCGALASTGYPLRVGGVILPPTKVLHVEPIYPLEAAEAGLQGLVILQATIGSGGQITDVEVLRSGRCSPHRSERLGVYTDAPERCSGPGCLDGDREL